MKWFFMFMELVLLICTIGACTIAIARHEWLTVIALVGIAYLIGNEISRGSQ